MLTFPLSADSSPASSADMAGSRPGGGGGQRQAPRRAGQTRACLSDYHTLEVDCDNKGDK